MPVLPAPKPISGEVKLLLFPVRHCQIPEAEQGTLLDTCPFKTTAGFAVREKLPPLPCLQDQTNRETVGRFFLSSLLTWDPLDISFNRHAPPAMPSGFPGLSMQYITAVVSVF